MSPERSVLITGGTGALGSAVTRRFLEDGHRVAATWIVDRERDALLEEIGGGRERLLLPRVDVTDAAAIEEGLREVAEGIGSVGVLVHLVGGWRGGEPVARHSLETWELMIRLNLLSAFLCTRAVLPGMVERDWGRIVLVSARQAVERRNGQAGYAVAKAGVRVLAETIAEETRGTGVTANTVAPSTIDTPANRAAMPNVDPSRWVPPSHAAAVIASLTTEEAGQLRGAWLAMYGSA